MNIIHIEILNYRFSKKKKSIYRKSDLFGLGLCHSEVEYTGKTN